MLFQVIDRGPKGKYGISSTFVCRLAFRSSPHNLSYTVYNVQTCKWKFVKLWSVWFSAWAAFNTQPCHSLSFTQFSWWTSATQHLSAKQQTMHRASDIIHHWLWFCFLSYDWILITKNWKKILRSSSTVPWYYRQPHFVISYVNWSSSLKSVIFLWPSEMAAAKYIYFVLHWMNSPWVLL